VNQEDIMNQLIIRDNFISEPICQKMIEGYNAVNKILNKETDNKLEIYKLQYINRHAYLYCNKVLKMVRDLILKKYVPNIFLDYAALFARKEGNKCELHCDNILLDCSTHGQRQQYLREVECNCSTATYTPNHTGWRDYTALLYLDSNHCGGDIIFQDGPVSKIYQKQIEARAGRLILTPNNRFFYHETTTVTKGVRYSMNMWFTCDDKRMGHLI
jgi:hypothetical protein